MAKKARGGPDDAGINMTPMIDIVFQMIIFFVCTVQLEKDLINEDIRLALAPDAAAVEKTNPNTVIIDVDRSGNIEIARFRMNESTLQQTMTSVYNRRGHSVPIVIRGDGETKHSDVKRVMDVVTKVGYWKIKFAAIKEKMN